MIKKTIKYKDLDGNEKTEDYWFQLTQAEFIRKAMVEGGEVYLRKLQTLSELKEDDVLGRGKEIMDVFETLLGDAVGRREDDLFIKDSSIKRRFMFSGAYDAFFMELLESPDSGATFLRNFLPGDAQEIIDKALAEKAAAEGKTVSASTLEDSVDASRVVQQEGQKAAETVQVPELEAAAPVLAKPGKDDEPAWLKEQRYPTKAELMRMPMDELQLATKMKGARAFGAPTT